jgi:phosphoglycolate phosphatase-like HAD superfamily hydrolase
MRGVRAILGRISVRFLQIEANIGVVIPTHGAAMAKLAIFDIDGTLVDSNAVDSVCFVRSIEEEFGIADIDDRWDTYKYATDPGILEEIFEKAFARKPSEPEIERHVGAFLALLREHYSRDSSMFVEIGGAAAMLDMLRTDPEWRVGIATGGWRESARFKLECAGIDHEGLPLVSGSDARSREEILRACIEKSKEIYGADGFDKIVSVGDAMWDLRTAIKLHIGFVGICAPRKFRDFQNCKTFRDYSGGKRFLKGLESAESPRRRKEK